jgi:uncharacterized membrane protein YdjX (TVP38/TMEM64 family)
MGHSDEEQVLERTLPEVSPEAARARRLLIGRLEYALLAAVLLLITALAFTFFYFDVDIARLTTYGYIGVFAVGFISAASIVLPMPGAAAMVGAGAVLDPILGVPAPIVVGIVGGIAEALGEITGYAAGFGGRAVIHDRSFYPAIESWMRRRGFITMFGLSAFPNPFFDIAGVAAGAVRMPLARFFLSVWAGKTVKNLYLAFGGLALGELAQALFE